MSTAAVMPPRPTRDPAGVAGVLADPGKVMTERG